MVIRIMKKFAFVLALALLMSPLVHGQDLVIQQPPTPPHLWTLDSLPPQRQLLHPLSEYPSSDIYPNWDNQFAHRYGNTPIPDTFRIDMRSYVNPIATNRVTSKYGPRRRRMHYGTDLKVLIGDTIRAAFDGRVRIVRYERKGYGKYVVIRHYNGLETIYGHLSAQLVAENQLVKAGDVIGLGGNTGRSTGSHLHFETRFLGQPIDPQILIDFEQMAIKQEFWTYRKRSNGRAASSQGGNGGGADTYYVRKGDTLSKIAARHGVSVNQLCKLNRITTTTTLRIGQKLRIY